MAKVKVVSATFKKEGVGKFGAWYSYDIKLDGDDKVYNYLGKTNPQTKFVAGQEVEAELSQNDKGYWNIKPVQAGGGFGGATASPQRLELDKKIAALNNAVAMVTAGKVGAEKLKDTFEKFLTEYLN